MTRTSRWCLVPALLACLAACADEAGERDAGRDARAASGVSDLPAPEGAVGSVTGMPANPGPGSVPIEPVATTQHGAGTGTGADATIASGDPAGTTDAVQVAGVDGGPLPPPAPPASVDGVEIFGGVPSSADQPPPEPGSAAVVQPAPTAADPPVTASTTFVTEPASTGEAHPEGHDDH